MHHRLLKILKHYYIFIAKWYWCEQWILKPLHCNVPANSGTYPSTRGQEAVFVGVGNGMAKSDIFVPYYRDMGTLIQRGVKLSQILLYWGGDERGKCFGADNQDFPFSVPIGSQPLHAAGAAYAVKFIKKTKPYFYLRRRRNITR